VTEHGFGRLVPPIFPHTDFPNRPPIRYLMARQREPWGESDMLESLNWFRLPRNQMNEIGRRTRYQEAITAQVGAASELDIRKDKL